MEVIAWMTGKIRIFLFGMLVTSLVLPGCIKDKYDFDMLSTQAEISQQWGLPLVQGSMKMGNMVKPNDTIVFEEDGVVKVVYRQDSVFSLQASDYMHVDDQTPDSIEIPLGPFHLYNFQGRISIPNVTGISFFPDFQKFTHVTFAGGIVSVTVINNLSVDISSLTLRFHNADDNSVIGSDLVYSNIPAHDSLTETFDLAGLTLSNRWTLEVVSISPATTSVPEGLTVSIQSSDVSGLSGNAVLPDQVFFSDTSNYDLNQDALQLTFLSTRKGHFVVTTVSPLAEPVAYNITFPTGEKDADTLKYSFLTNGPGSYSDTLKLNGASFNLASVATHPYNVLPYRYQVSLKSTGNLVDFDVTQMMKFKCRLIDPEFQYVEGYLGQKEYMVDEDTIEVGLDDFFNRIHGTLSLTNPQVRILYTNGFGIPVEIAMDVTGKAANGDEQALNAPSMRIQYPSDISEPPAEGILSFTRDNTDIVPLIDLLPSSVFYGGKAIINPDGFQGWTNFLSYDSDILLGLEVEVPLEFRMQDLQLQDTIENPFYDDTSDTSDFSLKNFEYVILHLEAENGFPVGMSFNIYIYDKASGAIVDSILFKQMIQPAPVDADGRVTGVMSSNQTVEITGAQLDELENTPDMIVAGIFNSTDQKSVKIYTDYTFDFKLVVQTKVNYEFDLGDASGMNNF